MLTKFVRNSRNLFFAGALLAVVAFGLTFMALSKAQQAATTAAATTATRATVVVKPTPVPPQLVARTNVPAFTQFTDPASIRQYFAQVPVTGYVSPDYVKGYSGASDLLTPQGGGVRHLAFALPKGDTLLATELATATVGTVDYAGLLNKGDVAETVSINPLAAVNGMVQPGDYVNLLLSLKQDLTLQQIQSGQYHYYTLTDENIDSSTPKTKVVAYIYQSQTALENLKVLNVSGNTYTLAMTNQEAVALKHLKDEATASGTWYIAELVVRAHDDTDAKDPYFSTTVVTPNSMASGKDYTHHTNPFNLP